MSDPVEEALFQRLGLSSNAAYDAQLNKYMKLLKSVGMDQPLTSMQKSQAQANTRAGIYGSQGGPGGSSQQQGVTLADRIPGNPFLPTQQEQYLQQQQRQAQNQRYQQQGPGQQGYGAQPGTYSQPGKQGGQSVLNSGFSAFNGASSHRASGTDESDDVLTRLGLCSNEEYVKKSRQEYKQAVNGLLEVQARWQNMG